MNYSARSRHASALLSMLLVAGCATVPPEPVFPSQGEFGPEQSFTGHLRLGFERQSFDECWLDFRGSAMADLGRLAPSPALADQTASYGAEVTLTGRRRTMVNLTGDDLMGQGFGHLGMYPCLIEATRITAASAQGAHPPVDSSAGIPAAEGAAAAAPAPSADLLADDLPFQNGFVEWESCQRMNAAETARRAGRAGPGGRPDFSGIRDCGSEYGRLLALVEALPADRRREQATALIAQARQAIEAMAAEIYHRNNYE